MSKKTTVTVTANSALTSTSQFELHKDLRDLNKQFTEWRKKQGDLKAVLNRFWSHRADLFPLLEGMMCCTFPENLTNRTFREFMTHYLEHELHESMYGTMAEDGRFRTVIGVWGKKAVTLGDEPKEELFENVEGLEEGFKVLVSSTMYLVEGEDNKKVYKPNFKAIDEKGFSVDLVWKVLKQSRSIILNGGSVVKGIAAEEAKAA